MSLLCCYGKWLSLRWRLQIPTELILKFPLVPESIMSVVMCDWLDSVERAGAYEHARVVSKMLQRREADPFMSCFGQQWLRIKASF